MDDADFKEGSDHGGMKLLGEVLLLLLSSSSSPRLVLLSLSYTSRYSILSVPLAVVVECIILILIVERGVKIASTCVEKPDGLGTCDDDNADEDSCKFDDVAHRSAKW